MTNQHDTTDPTTEALASSLGRRRFIQGAAIVGGGLVSASLLGRGIASASTVPVTEPAGTGAAGPSSGVIGVTLNGLNDYTKGVATGVYKAIEGTDYTLEVVQVNYSADEELAAAEAFVAKGVVGLVIQPNTVESAGAAAEVAFNEGIPAGNCIWPGPSDADQFFVGVAEIDSVEGGRLIGRWLIDNAEPGKICVVQGVVGQGFSERIDEGLDEVLADTDFEVVVREQAFFDRTQAIDVVSTAFQAHPDLGIVVAYSASMSNGIAQWLQDNGKEDVVHVSSDADEEMVTWIKTPYLSATRYYSSAQTGLIAGTAVVTALAGGTPEFQTVVDQVIATGDDIDAVVEANPFMFMEYKDLVQDI